MRIINVGKKFLIKDYTIQESMDIRRRGVNITYDKINRRITAEDNIFNRIILNLKLDFVTTDLDVDSFSLSSYTRDYQAIDIRKSLKYKNILNRNKMGYGKTFEAIEYCRLLGLKKILVICPKSVIGQWKNQFIKWWPKVENIIVDAPQGKNVAQIFITNFESLGDKKHFQLYQKLKMFAWDVIVCDESHRIKNAKSLRAMRLKQLPTVRKMALTGTPILKNPDDLWNQLNWFGDKYSGGSYWAFVERFCSIEENEFNKKITGLTQSDTAKKLLGQVLDTISIGGGNQKLTKGKNHILMKLDMMPKMKKRHKQLIDLAIDELEAEGVTVKNAMDQYVKLQMLTCVGVPGEVNPKFQWLKDWLEDTDGKPILVFSKYATAVEALQKYLGKDVVKLYTGKQKQSEREELIKDFTAGKFKILAGTIGALGMSIDGLQYACSDEAFLDEHWDPPINEQAEDRVDRSGQPGYTNIYNLQIKGSFDEHITEVVNHRFDDIEELKKWIKSWC